MDEEGVPIHAGGNLIAYNKLVGPNDEVVVDPGNKDNLIIRAMALQDGRLRDIATLLKAILKAIARRRKSAP